MIVSIIITTKNEAKHIGNCLESIRKQDFTLDKIEIIVVDNNSADSTLQITRRYTDKIYTYGPERSAQRNYGVRQATGKYILYLDADMILSENVIQECLNKCENEGCIALYIPERIIGKGFWIKVRDFERSFYNATVIDCVRFVKRDKFLEVGGFDEGLTGPEDWDFDRKINEVGKVAIINSPIYHNEGRFSFRRYINKKIYYAKSFDKYIKKCCKDDLIIKQQLGLQYRFFEVFIENKKWVKLVHHPWLTLGMYFLKFILGIRFLTQYIWYQ